jgi:PQQ-dependent dehydrogenase (methanol/ethanol family)
MTSRRVIQILTAIAVFVGAQAHAQSVARVDMKRLLNANAERGQWLTHGRTFDEQYFSPLNKINERNVNKLGLAWFVDLPTNQNVESTPLMIDGVLYITLPWSKVMALDARSGKQLWLYDPKVAGAWNINICCGVDNRGAAAWKGKIIFGTLDGRLIALDAKTGKPVWTTKATPDKGRYSITGAPRIANGRIFIGSAGGEFDARGYLDAYDADTGKLLWRFWTVPGDPAAGFENKTMEMAAATWKTPGWWKTGGGGTVWDAITYDPATDLVIFGTGNGTPGDAIRRDAGGGDNLFMTSIVAVHAKDGSYAWHYQTTPWETWDYDTGQQLMLLDIEINGKKRHVVSQASKNGFFYHLDAATGQLGQRRGPADRPSQRGAGGAHQPHQQGLQCRARTRRRTRLAIDVLQSAHRARLYPGDDTLAVDGPFRCAAQVSRRASRHETDFLRPPDCVGSRGAARGVAQRRVRQSHWRRAGDQRRARHRR